MRVLCRDIEDNNIHVLDTTDIFAIESYAGDAANVDVYLSTYYMMDWRNKMDKRLVLTRKEITTRLEQIAKTGAYDDIKKMSAVVEGITCPTLPFEGTTDPLTARQYACFSASMAHMYDQDKQESVWQIYDFVTGKDDETMGFGELQALCLLLEFYTWIL